MARSKLKVGFVALFTLASCSQLIGINDYAIDPSLDGTAGGEDGGGGEGPGPTPNGGAGGEAGESALGGGASAGEPALGGSGNAGEGGAGGAAALRELVPCDSQDCCDAADGEAVGEEMLGDVGFELGPVAGGQTPWRQESTKSFQAITDDVTGGWEPNSGAFYAYLSGIAGERTSIYTEHLTVPSDAGWLELSGFRYFQIDVKDDVNKDFCGIAFYDLVAEDPVELPFLWSAPSNNGDGWGESLGWVPFEASWDAAPHHGKKRYLGLRGESDLYPADPMPDDMTPAPSSSYLFDDVSLKVFRCYEKQ